MIDVPVSDLISKDLRRWFKEKWVDVSRKDKDGKHPPCGRSEAKTDSKGYPKCRPSKKVSSKTPETTRGISSKEKKAMTRRKRSKPQGVGGKPTMVKSELPPAPEIPEWMAAIAGSGRFGEMKEILEGVIPEVKTEETGRDPCCQEAFNAQLASDYARSESGIQDYADRYMNGDFCAALRHLLESSVERAHDWLTTPLEERRREMEEDAAYQIKIGKPHMVVSVEEMNEGYQSQYDQHKKVLDNWDACSASKLPDDGMFTASADPFEAAWGSITKGRFRGYTQSNISNRPYRQAEHRVWDISRKVKRERTKKRYARNKSRGTVRPAMRRQLGAGGKRASTKR
jgi:hypothetical protein